MVQWGPLLLQITAHWSPKQISSLSGGRLKPNSIVKRIKAAKLQAGETQEQVKFPEKGSKTPRKRKREDTHAVPQIGEDGLNAEQLNIESEASRKFRISQMEIEEAVKAKDPNYELRQIGRIKKIPRLDRILIDQAFEERKENMISGYVYTPDAEDVIVDANVLIHLTPTIRAKHDGIELVQLD